MQALGLFWSAHHEQSSQMRHARRIRRRALENVEEMQNGLFQERFRLDKPTFRQLCQDLKAHTHLRGTAEIPLEIKVLCALSFFATGSYQRIVGITQHLIQRTASRCIREVVDALNHPVMTNKWIRFPQTPEERSCIRQEFQRKFRLPGVIGCIDCTHIAIVKPNDEEHLFFNRKGYHSLNVQMICDHNLRILNVNSKYGGATHDSFIWASSQVEPYMRELHQANEQVWLLGDSGYPLRTCLLTPILDAAPGSREEMYTQRHVQARNCIERCFGVLKSRWRCLLKDRVLHYQPRVASKITIACCVLHNMALSARLPPPPEQVDDGHDDNHDHHEYLPNIGNENELVRGRALLNSVIDRL